MKLGETNSEELLAMTEPEELLFNVQKVVVTYGDESTREWHPRIWANIRQGVVTNLFERDLCSIEFIPVNRKDLVIKNG